MSFGPSGARRIRLVAYGARLESVLGASPRGFESPILRHVNERRARRVRRSFALLDAVIRGGRRAEPDRRGPPSSAKSIRRFEGVRAEPDRRGPPSSADY